MASAVSLFILLLMIRPKYTNLPSAPHITFNTPSTEAVTDAFVDNVLKADLNVSDDAYIDDLINLCTEESEKFTMRAYINRDITVVWSNICQEVTLPVAGYNSITSASRIDKVTGVETAFTSDDYVVIPKGDYVNVRFKSSWGDIIKIVYNAGYGASYTSCPAWVRDAVANRVKMKYARDINDLMMARTRYESTELNHQFIYYDDFSYNNSYDIDYVFPTSY